MANLVPGRSVSCMQATPLRPNSLLMAFYGLQLRASAVTPRAKPVRRTDNLLQNIQPRNARQTDGRTFTTNHVIQESRNTSRVMPCFMTGDRKPAVACEARQEAKYQGQRQHAFQVKVEDAAGIVKATQSLL
jgi:hypothetical protein